MKGLIRPYTRRPCPHEGLIHMKALSTRRPYPYEDLIQRAIMPRTSEKHQVLEEIESATELATCALLASSPEEEEGVEEDIKDLLALQDIIESHRYLSSRIHSAGRHTDDSLDAYIHHYPDIAFLVLFRMHWSSFWEVVELLTRADATNNYWCQQNTGPTSGRPIYQQVAVGLYVLGGGETVAKSRIVMNIGHGMAWVYA